MGEDQEWDSRLNLGFQIFSPTGAKNFLSHHRRSDRRAQKDSAASSGDKVDDKVRFLSGTGAVVKGAMGVMNQSL